MALTFGTPTQIPQPPQSRMGRWGNQNPANPAEYWLHKDEWVTVSGSNGPLYFQRRDVSGTWLTEETVFGGLQVARPRALMEVDAAARAMILYRDNDAAPDVIRAAWRNPATAIWTVTTLQDATFAQNEPYGLQPLPGGGFVAVVMMSGSGEGKRPHPHLWEWNPLTESWSAALELPELDAGASLVSKGVTLGVNPVDGFYHLAAVVSYGAPFQYKTYHAIHDPVARTTTAWALVNNPAFPIHNYDSLILGSPVDPGAAHLIYTRNNEGDGTNSWIQYLHYYEGLWHGPTAVSTPGLVAGAQANMIVDVNDDVYVCYSEWDGSKMAVFARRRLASNGQWEDAVKVGTSTLGSANGWDYNTQSDPYWPGFIRPPYGRPIQTLPVVWGSQFQTFQNELWISEAVVRDEGDDDFDFQEGEGGKIYNDNVRVFDGVVGGSWSKWRGKDV